MAGIMISFMFGKCYIIYDSIYITYKMLFIEMGFSKFYQFILEYIVGVRVGEELLRRRGRTQNPLKVSFLFPHTIYFMCFMI